MRNEDYRVSKDLEAARSVIPWLVLFVMLLAGALVYVVLS